MVQILVFQQGAMRSSGEHWWDTKLRKPFDLLANEFMVAINGRLWRPLHLNWRRYRIPRSDAESTRCLTTFLTDHVAVLGGRGLKRDALMPIIEPRLKLVGSAVKFPRQRHYQSQRFEVLSGPRAFQQ